MTQGTQVTPHPTQGGLVSPANTRLAEITGFQGLPCVFSPATARSMNTHWGRRSDVVRTVIVVNCCQSRSNTTPSSGKGERFSQVLLSRLRSPFPPLFTAIREKHRWRNNTLTLWRRWPSISRLSENGLATSDERRSLLGHCGDHMSAVPTLFR